MNNTITRESDFINLVSTIYYSKKNKDYDPKFRG